MWQPQRPTTLWASTACYGERFTFFLLCHISHHRENIKYIDISENMSQPWKRLKKCQRRKNFRNRLTENSRMPEIRRNQICKTKKGSFKHEYIGNLQWSEFFRIPEIWDVKKYSSLNIFQNVKYFNSSEPATIWKSSEVLKIQVKYFQNVSALSNIAINLFMKRNVMSIAFTCSTSLKFTKFRVYIFVTA
jgi:hypothetical protein